MTLHCTQIKTIDYSKLNCSIIRKSLELRKGIFFYIKCVFKYWSVKGKIMKNKKIPLLYYIRTTNYLRFISNSRRIVILLL